MLTTKDLIVYVNEKHGRHWGIARINKFIKNGLLKRHKFGSMNVYLKSDIDSCVSSLTRPSNNGKRGE